MTKLEDRRGDHQDRLLHGWVFQIGRWSPSRGQRLEAWPEVACGGAWASGISVKDFEQKDGVFSLEAMTASSLDGGLAEFGAERDPTL